MSTGAAIDIFKEGRVLTSVSLAPPKREWTVGRSLDSDICINHPSVSRVHCRISEDDGAYFISDCASVHGTRMNQQPLPPNLQMRLFDGLTIELGSSSRSLVPRGTVASVVAAVHTAAQQAAAAEKRRQEAEDDEDADEAVGEAAGGAVGGGAGGAVGAGVGRGVGREGPGIDSQIHAQQLEDEQMRAHLPSTFGKQLEVLRP